MALLLTNASLQNINYGSFSGISSLPQKSWILWFNKTADANGGMFVDLRYNSITVDSSWSIYTRVTGKIRFQYPWTTATSNVGLWDSDVVANNSLNQLIITYDDTSTSNTPIMYVNGASVTVTTVNSPSGSTPTGTNNTLRVGSAAASNGFDGNLYGFCLYNRILSASEALDAYNSKLAIPTRRGLIFAPQLWGCAGGVAESGTMAAGNTVADAVSGALGVPSGSPVFKGDTVLTFQS